MGKRVVITRGQFFKVCELFRNKREQILTDRPTEGKLCRMVKEELGFEVSTNVVDEAKQTVDIAYEVKKQRGNREEGRSQRYRSICKAIVVLYRQLGLTPPEDFLDTVQSLYGEGHTPQHMLGREDAPNRQSKQSTDGNTPQTPFPSSR